MRKAEILENYEVVNTEVRNVNRAKICSYVPAEPVLLTPKSPFFAPILSVMPLAVMCFGGISDFASFQKRLINERARVS
jgi:hypothetical protein